MGNWILHIVGETLDDDLAPAVKSFVDEIQKLSHKVHAIRLTTDTGEKVIHVANVVESVVDTVAKDAAKVDPALEPEATAAEDAAAAANAELEKAVADVEKVNAPPTATGSSPATSTDPTPPAPIPTA